MISNFLTAVSQTRIFQWTINKCRENLYPWVYNKWEANQMLDDDNLWLGSLESACDREAMKARGITHVVSAVYDINPIFPDDPELMYLKVPVIDKPTTDIAKHFDRAIDFIDDALKKIQRKGGGVLVHCVFGISRSSTLICAYLIKKKGMSVKQAIAHVKARRPQANPNTGFLTQLQVLQESNAKNTSYYDYFANDDYAQ